MSRSLRALSRVAVFGAALLWLACGEAPTVPMLEILEAPLPEVEAPAPSFAVVGIDGQMELPVPPHNFVGFGAVGPIDVVSFEAGDFVLVTVSGTVTTELTGLCPNQSWYGGTWTPWGDPANGQFRVEFTTGGYSMPKDQTQMGTSVKTQWGWFQEAGTVDVKRFGGGGACTVGHEGGWSEHPGLYMSGSQVVTYAAYPAAEVTEVPEWVLTGDAAVLTAESYWQLTDIRWGFETGDTGETPGGPGWGSTGCTGSMTCTFQPPASGRPYLIGKIRGQQVWVAGPILWVLDEPPPTCPPPSEVQPVPCMQPDPRSVVVTTPSGDWAVRPAKTGGVNTLELTVGVVDEAGIPHPNSVVDFSLDGIEGSGGHVHAGDMPSGSLSAASVNTGPTGFATVVYTAPEFAGEVELHAISPEGTATTVVINVQVPELVALTESGTIELIGMTGTHPMNHWGTAAMVARLQATADALFDRYSVRLQIHDMSLIHGGKFDLNNDYSAASDRHGEHRIGESADIRTVLLNQAQQKFLISEWERLGGSVFDEPLGSVPYLHFRAR